MPGKVYQYLTSLIYVYLHQLILHCQEKYLQTEIQIVLQFLYIITNS